MQCLQCQAGNEEGRRFCGRCGAPLAVTCPNCGFANAPSVDFCGGCGKEIATDAVPPPDRALTRETAEPERRQLTVMFCDLVGSTTLAERLDPEELHEILAQYQDACANVIGRFDGYIARYLGDGLLVYFGYPQAHEDDAQRAVRAGLGIVEAIRELDSGITNPNVNLAVRIGITTGFVVAGDIGSGERVEKRAIVGETPNLAARLQAQAEPNTVVIGASTHRLVEGLFDCDDLGPQNLKGISQRVTAYRVRTESDAPSRFEASAIRGLTPLVGREEEVGLLLKRWEQAKEGESQVVLLSGEAGIGKSRIVRSFQEHLKDELRNRVLYYCSPYYQNSALYPAIDQLERALRFEKNDSEAQRLDKLEAVLSDLGLPAQHVAPVLTNVLSLPTGERYPKLTLSPQELKKKTLETYVSLIGAMASQNPVLMVVEDVHWIDPSTQELITLLIEQLTSARFLILLIFRPEFESPWGAHTHVTSFTLNRLSRKESAAMVTEVTEGKALPDEVLDQVVAKTDGVPLFVEELTKNVLESGLLEDAGDHYKLSGPLPSLAIPASLQDSLMARLDRLAPVKEVAQLAATLGRTFSHELLAAVSPLTETELEHALAQLLNAELVYRRGLPPNARYEFKHALVQDTAYQSLLKSTRQQYHLQIAEVLEKRFPDTVGAQPELLAHHYTEAGLAEQAIGYWQKAGERAHEQSANLEAIGHLTTGIAVLQGLPDNQERARQELEFQVSLGSAIVCAKSHTAVEAQAAYARGRELCEQLGDVPELTPTLFGLWRFYVARSSLVEASELAMELLRLAEETDDAVRHVLAYYALGFTATCKGELADARHHFEKGTAQYSPSQRSADVYRAAQDPGVACRSWGSVTEWLLGFPDQAQDRMRESVALAEEIEDSFSLAYAKVIGAIVSEVCGNDAESKKMAQSGIDLAVEKGFPLWSVFGQISRNWILFKEEHTASMFDELCENVSAQSALISSFAPYFMTRLALAYRQAEQIEEGLHVLDSAQSLVEGRILEGRGERWWEAEIHRLQGELLVSKSSENVGVAKACFEKALHVARHQGAKSLELRAAMSLGRLWQQQGKVEEARKMLSEIYGWFTEGFDTADLKEAKDLLDNLMPPTDVRVS